MQLKEWLQVWIAEMFCVKNTVCGWKGLEANTAVSPARPVEIKISPQFDLITANIMSNIKLRNKVSVILLPISAGWQDIFSNWFILLYYRSAHTDDVY